MTIIEAAGERIHLVESGPAEGVPLLLSTGLGGAWFDWAKTVELLAETHRVICFDRPGLGLSPGARAVPSLRREVALLAALAEYAGPPAIVVAHSVAGFHAEALARIHPKLVRGVVLVDPSYEPSPRLWPRTGSVVTPLATAFGWTLERTRAARVLGPAARRLVMRQVSDKPEPVPQQVVREVYGRGTVLGTALAENSVYREMAVDLAALRKRLPFPPIPLVVLTALGDLDDPGKAHDWTEGHRDLAAMTPYGRQIDLPDTLHLVQLDHPVAVAEAVAEVTGRQ